MRSRTVLATFLALACASLAQAAPDLVAEKKAIDNDGAPLEHGDLLVYVIGLANRGADPATSVVFHDLLSADLASVTVVSVPPGAVDESDFTASPPYVRITGFDVAPGSTASIVFSAFIAAGAPGPLVCNQGEVTSAEIAVPILTDDPATAAPADATCLALDGAVVILKAVKTLVDPNGAPVEPGDTLLYTIDVDNLGSADSTLTDLVDPIAPAFDAVVVLLAPPGSTDVSVLTGPAREVHIKDFTIAAGARASVVFSATLGAAAQGRVCNQAFVRSNEVTLPAGSDDPATVFPGDPTCLRLPGVPGLRLTKSARDLDGGALGNGDRVLYWIEIENPGTAAATRVSLSDPLPRGLRNLATLRLPPGAVDRSVVGGPSPAFAADGFTIEAGSSVILAYAAEVAPSASGLLCNQARATSFEISTPVPSDDPATFDPLDATCLLAGNAPDLRTSTQFVIDDNGLPAAPGDRLTWTIEARNTGTAPASAVSVPVAIPAELVNLAVTSLPAGATLQSTSPTLRVDGFDVAPGAVESIVFTADLAAAPDGTTVCLRALLSASELPGQFSSDDPATRPLDDPTCLTIGPALVTSTKDLADVDRGALEPGDLIFYAIDVRNSGSAVASAVAVSDDLPSGLVNLAVVSIPAGAVDASDLAATPPRVDVSGFDVAAGASERILIAGEVGLVPPAPELCNQARVTSSTLTAAIPTDDATTLVAGDPTCVELGLASALQVTKEVVSIAGTVPAAPGDLLLWIVRVTNAGTGPARAVRLVDVLSDLVQPALAAAPEGAVDLTDAFATPPLVAVEIPRIEPGATAVVAFFARVAAVPTASDICNRALVSSRETVSPIGSDDPATSAAGDQTCLTATPTGGPNVTAIDPCLGSKKGGTRVTIAGTGFLPGATVTFDGLDATVESASATQIVVRTPPHPAVGPIDVVVTNPDGMRDLVSGGFVYTPPPFPIHLGGSKKGSDAWLIWTGGLGENVVLRSNSPDFACPAIDAKVSTTSTLQDPGKGKNRNITYYRVE